MIKIACTHIWRDPLVVAKTQAARNLHVLTIIRRPVIYVTFKWGVIRFEPLILCEFHTLYVFLLALRPEIGVVQSENGMTARKTLHLICRVCSGRKYVFWRRNTSCNSARPVTVQIPPKWVSNFPQINFKQNSPIFQFVEEHVNFWGSTTVHIYVLFVYSLLVDYFYCLLLKIASKRVSFPFAFYGIIRFDCKTRSDLQV